MKRDIVLAGVGGQGVLSVGELIARSALVEGLAVKQGEVHGMAQRGGAVQAFLRLADRPISSDLVPEATADLILSMEPLEGLRYLRYLAPDGVVVTATEPVRNVPDYPDSEKLLARIAALPHSLLVDARRLAEQAGSTRAVNVVMVGAVLHLLPIAAATVEQQVRRAFGRHGERMVEVNLRALAAGREAVACLTH
ncbi:MAG: indolepyruvate oxidoreductase subunit beta [Thermoanaerobaculia bacterium]